MARFIDTPNQFGFIEWTEKVSSLDGDNLLISVELDAVDSGGGFTDIGKELSEVSYMSYETSVEILSDGTKEVTVNIETDPSELSINEVYRFKAIADDGSITETRTFELSVLEALKVSTEGTNSVGATQVSLAGDLQTLGESTEADVTFQYREKGTQQWNFANFQETGSPGLYNINVTNLDGSRTYEFRAYSIGNRRNQTAEGNVIEITTGDSVKVLTSGSGNVLGTSADLTGNLKNLGGAPATDVGFEYRQEIFNTVTFNRTKDLSEDDTSITDVYFKPDGTKMYVSGSGGVNIYQYNLNRAWDVTSASFVSSINVSDQDSAPTGVYLKSNGGKLYFTGANNGKVYEYRLSTRWDLSTASINNTFDVNTRDSNPSGITFGREGRRMYCTGSSNDNVYEYGLPNPWDISTASFRNSLDISSEDQSPRGLTLGSEGIKLYTVGDVNSNVYEYDLSSQWDISTASYNRSFDVSPQDSSPRGIRFHTDKTSMYVVGRNNNSIFEYDIDGQYKKTSTQRLTSTGAYTEELINLETDTTYEFRAFADALGGESDRGQNKKFTTQPAIDLTTEFAEDIDTTTLTLVGTLNNLGGASNSDVYFEYREVETSSWTQTVVQNLTSSGEFREGVTNLTVGTEYEFRAVAESSDGDTATGSTLIVETDNLFSVTTDAPTNIEENTVTFNATLDNLGGANTADAYFEYRKVGESNWNLTPFETIVSDSTQFAQTLTTLDANTEYEFAARGDASDGDNDVGSAISFTTNANLDITTDSVNVSGNEATINGTLNDLGGANDAIVFFEFRESGTSNWNRSESEKVTSPASYSKTIKNLNGGTEYEVRAKVNASDEDSANGSILTFTSASGLNINTGSIDDVDTNTVDVSGSLDNLGGASEADVFHQSRTYYRNRFGALVPTAWEDTSRTTLTSTGSFSNTISGLNASTFYEIRAKAVASDGDVAAGAILETNTDPYLSVETDNVSYIGSDSATLEGTLKNLGAASSTDVFFEYRQLGESVWNSTTTDIKNSPDKFSKTITGLTTDVEYEYRAAVNASDGDTDTGTIQTFTPRPIGLITKEATDVTNDTATLRVDLTDLGGAESADVSFQYRKQGSSTWINTNSQEIESTGIVSESLDGLDVESIYEFRATATSSDGDSATSSIVTFNTRLVTTENSSDIDTNSVSLNSTVYSLGGATSAEIFFEYRETGESIWNTTPKETITSGGPFSQSISGLTVDTQYEFRVQFNASDGDSVTGTLRQFKTDTFTSVSTDPAGNIGDSFAVLNGSVNDLGGASSVDAYFEYRETGSSNWIASSDKQTLNSTGSYTITIDGINPTTEYEARARIDASDGDTDTGDSVVTFITDIELVVTTDQIDNIFQDSVVVTGSLNDLGEANDADVYFEYRQTGWDVSRASYNDDSLNVGSEDQNPRGLTFKDDGSKLFIVGFENDNVYEYNLGSDWDITTASFNDSFNVLSEDGSPRDIVIGSNGSKMYILGHENDNIFEYDLSVSWGVSSATFVRSTDISSEETNPRGIFFKNDGQRLYLTGISGESVFEYDLADSWDISTASFYRSFDVSNQDITPTGVHFRDNGSQMYITGDSNDAIFEYELSTPWNITTASFDQSLNVSSETNNLTGMTFKTDGFGLFISSDGDSNIYKYEIPTNWSPTNQQNLTTIGSYQETAEALNSDTEYDVRARADASDGDTSFGSPIRFTTEKAIQVQTDDSTNVDEDKGTLNATLNDLGEAANADVFFEYKQSTSENWIATPSSVNVMSPTSYSQNIIGLSPNTDYEFRARVEASDGDTGLGSTKTFTTNKVFTVSTGSITNIDNSTVELEGELVDISGASSADVFFEYREVGASTWNTSTSQTLNSTGTYSTTVGSLSSGVDYEYRAVGNASDGDVSYGNIETFTGGTPPVVSTDTPTNVDVSSITFNGVLDDLGGASSADVYFEYRTGDSTEWNTTTTETLNSAGSVTFFRDVTGLTIDKLYEVRAVAEASDGNIGRGSVVEIATDTVLKVDTTGSSSINVYSATLEGALNDLGGASTVGVFFEYRVQGQSNWTTTSSQSLSFDGSFSQTVTGLSVDTTYEFRAKANASDGDTATGPIMTVKPFSVTTGEEVNQKDTNSLTLSGSLVNLDGYSSVDVSFQYRVLGSSTWTKTSSETLNLAGDFSREIFNLQSDTEYEYRAFADFLDSNTANSGIETEKTHKFVSVTTNDPSEIDSDRITLNGTLEELGGASNADVYFDFREKGSPVWNSRERKTTTSTGTFEDEVTGLKPDTEYEVRARVEASDGDAAIGSVITVTTLQDIVISTDSVSGVDTDIVTFNGTLGFLGGANSADVYFEYRETKANDWNTSSRQTLMSTGSFSINVEGLEPDTEYEFRSFMEASDGDTKAGSVLTFITDPQVSIITELVTTLGNTSATLRSTVENLGNASSAEVYFEYRKTGNSSWTTTLKQAITSTGPVNEDITGLDSNDDYEYRANIEASDGDTDQGDVVTFVTNPDPLVITDNVSDIGGSTVTFNGTLERRGGALSVDSYFEYRKTGAASWNATSIQVLTTTGGYSLQVSGLDQQSDYEFRAVIDASDGDSATGVAVTFTTGILPTLQTNLASNLRGSSFTANGEITDLGTASTVEAFFEYRETGSSTWKESARQSVDSTGVFSTNISNLSTTTEYEYRSKIITEAGDVITASTVTVTTDDAVSVVTDSPDVSGDRATLNGLVEDLGGAQSADVFFEFREVGTSSFTTTPLENISIIGSFSREITNLTPKTEYEYRAQMEASDQDTDSGILVKFTTDPLIDLSTDGSDNVDTKVATLLGTISNLGGAESADVHFQYRQFGSSSWNRSEGNNISVTQSISENITGLEPNSQYKFRIKADTSDGDSEVGSILNFTTDELASVKTGSVQDTTFQSATVEANVESLGGASSAEFKFEYRESGTATWNTTPIQSINSTGIYSAQIGSLSKNTDYEFRPILNASDGDTDAGQINLFTTDEESNVEVSTNSASNINVNDVTLNGSLDNLGQLSSVIVNFKYREVGSSAWNETSTQTLNSTGNFNQTISGLSENTEFEYQAKAEGPVTGSTFTVQTLPLFTISTNQPFEVSAIYGILEGSLDEFNGISSVDVNFEWRETGTNSWNSTDNQTLSSTSNFTEKLGGFPSLNFENNAVVSKRVSDPDGIAFNSDGSKMFVAERGPNEVIELELSTLYDISTAKYNTNLLNVGGNPSGLAFNSDGTKLFVSLETGAIEEYALSESYTISEANLTYTFNPNESGNQEDVTFNSDGTRMFIPDRGSEQVYQYNLSTGFDLSTVSYSGNSFATTNETTRPDGVVFNSDGTRMIVSGGQNTEGLYQYDLSNGFDITTVSYTGNSFSVPEDTFPEGVAVNGDGTKFYVSGGSNDDIFQYDTGGSAYDTTNLSFETKYDRFDPTNNAEDIEFGDDGNRLYVLDQSSQRVFEYSLDSPYNLTNLTFTGNTLDISGDISGGFNDTLNGLTISPNGKKLHIAEGVGDFSTRDKVHQYSLGSFWDLSSASYDFNKELGTDIRNLRFGDNGNKLYTVQTNNNNIREREIDAPYDISNFIGGDVYDVGSEGTPKAVEFVSGGKRMFVFTENGSIFEHELNTAFDTSTASYTGREFNSNISSNVSGKEILFGSGIEQTFLYDSEDIIREYSLSTLKDNTEYEYRALGTADSLIKQGQNVNFTTKNELSVSTDTATNVGVFDATLNGIVNESGSNNQIDTFFEFRERNTVSYRRTPVELNSEGDVLFSEFKKLQTLTGPTYTFDSPEFNVRFVKSTQFDSTGNKFFVYYANTIYQYSLSIPYDLSTANFTNKTYDASGLNKINGDKHIEFGRGGSRLFILTRQSTSEISPLHQLNLDNAYDISSVTSTKLFETSTGSDQRAFGYFDITDDGSSIFYLRENNNDLQLIQRDFGTPYEVDTITNFNRFEQFLSGNRSSFEFADNGNIYYTVDRNPFRLQKYSLNTHYDITAGATLEEEVVTSVEMDMVFSEDKTIWLNKTDSFRTNLQSDTNYEYKFNGVNSLQSDEGSFARFSTDQQPLVSTVSFSSVTFESVEFTGNVETLGGKSSAEVSFEYKNPLSTTWNETQRITVNSTGYFTQSVSGLTNNTSYTVRARIETNAVSYGSVIGFKTNKDFRISTNPATNVQFTSATFNGDISVLNTGSADVFFEYRQTGNTSWQSTSTETVNNTGNYSKNITGLNQDTEYQYRFVVTSNGTTRRGVIYTLYTEITWIDSFETGLSAWNVIDSNMQIKTNRVYDGSQSVGIEDFTSTNGTLIEKSISADQPESIEWFWQETSNSTGSALHIINSDGNLEVAAGSNNPQWELYFEGSSIQVLSRSGSEYDRWIRVKIIFDWENNTFDYEMEDLQDGTFETGTENLAYGVDIDRIGIGSPPGGSQADSNWWDKITIDKQPLLSVSTQDSSLSNSTATLNGTLDNFQFSGDATVYFEWRREGADSWNKTSDQTLSSTGTFSDTITIDTNYEYEYRSKAEASGLTSIGGEELINRIIKGTTPDGLWTMDSRDISNNILIEPVNGYDAHDTKNVTTGVSGRENTAFSFDGSSSDYLPIEGLNFNTSGAIDQMTLGTWVKFENNENGGVVLGFDANEYFRYVIRPTSVSDNSGFSYDLDNAIDDGNWHNIVYVFDSTASGYDTRLYLDGNKVEETTAHGGTAFGSGTTRYGFFGDDSEATSFDGNRNNRGFEGDLDEFRYYASSLSTSEVEEIYGAQLDSFVTNTKDPSNKTDTSATLNSFIGLSDADSADVFFEYRVEGSSTWNTTTTETINSSQTYSKTISGLTTKERYEYRINGTDNFGNSDTGNIVSFVALSNFVEDFETDLSNWTVNEASFSTTTSPVYVGSQSAGMEGTISQVDLIERNINYSEPSGAEWYWWETTYQTGSAFHFYNSNGNRELALGTDNPQWTAWDGTGSRDRIFDYGGNDRYQEWIFFQITSFDWSNGTYDYYLENTVTGDVRTGTRSLSHGVDVERVAIGSPPGGKSSHHSYWDNVKIIY